VQTFHTTRSHSEGNTWHSFGVRFKKRCKAINIALLRSEEFASGSITSGAAFHYIHSGKFIRLTKLLNR
jgi:hypothetical protein